MTESRPPMPPLDLSARARWRLALLLALLLAATTARAQMSFEHVVVDDAGPQDLWGKSIGDLDGDGRPDLIVGGNAGGGLVWYESPSWTKRTIAASGAFSTDHEVCDVDLDGAKDVVSLRSNALVWFEAPAWSEHEIARQTLHDIEVFDFEGDGDCDVAARNQGSFSGSGATLFLYRQLSPDSWSESTHTIPDGEGLAAADLDSDGDLDLVVNEVWVENRGSDLESWTQHSYTTTWTHGAAFVTVADIDDDGRLDIALAPAERKDEVYRISWFEAPDDPTLSGWSEHVVEPDVEAVLHFLGAGDFDRDGDVDLASAAMLQGSNPDEVVIHRNEGGAWTRTVISQGGSHSMRVVDIDLDGDPDLVGANFQTAQVDLWLNRTPPDTLSLDAWERHVIDPKRPGRALFIAADDLDDDGLPDVAAGGFWYRNPGSADGSWLRAAIGAPLNNMALLHDFDGDGDVDILGTEGVGSEAAPGIAWARNDGAGSFEVLDGIASGSGDFPQGVSVARLAPGERERVVLSWHAGSDGVEALVVPDDPSGGPWPLELLSPETQREDVSGSDIDRDGDVDVLLGTTWLRNAGTSFESEPLFATGEPPDRNRLADIDRDGRLDAVIGYEAISTTGTLAWYRQPPVATDPWSEHVIARITGPMSLDVADMDGDGDLDVVAGEHDLADPASAGLWVFENSDGIGESWTPHEVYTGDEHHDGAQVVDIDQDGDLDILSIGWSHDRVLLYENRAVPEPGGTISLVTGLLSLCLLRRLRGSRVRGQGPPRGPG